MKCEQEVNMKTALMKCSYKDLDVNSSVVIIVLHRLLPELSSWSHTELPYIEKTHFNIWISNSYLHTV